MHRSILYRYRPEIVAFILLTAYTVIRTIIVAKGISPVSDASWVIFLFIEIVTAAPYVWAVGDIVRSSLGNIRHDFVRRFLVYATAIITFSSPYAYLLMYGALNTQQGALFFVVLILLFLLPTLTKQYIKLSDRRKTRKHKRV